MSIDTAIQTLEAVIPDDNKQTVEWPPIPLPKLPEPPRFPLEALPKVLRDMAEEVSQCVKTPPALSASAILAAVGFAIGRRTFYYYKKSIKGRANLYMLIFAARGERKSTVYELLENPFNKWQSEKIKEYNQSKFEFEIKQTRLERLKEKMSNPNTKPDQLAQASAEAMELFNTLQNLPPSPNLFTNDSTQEAMVQKMSQSGGLLGVFSDDGRTIMKIIIGKKYSKDGSASDELFLDSFDGTKTVNYDRSGRSIKPIERPCIGLLLMIQPDLLRAMGEQKSIFESGFNSRCLFAYPESWVGKRHSDGTLMRDIDDTEVSDATAKAYEELIIRFLNQNFGAAEDRYIGLSLPAQEFWRKHYREIEGESGEDGIYNHVLDFAVRYPSQTLRIALIIALVNEHEKIELEDIQSAHTIMQYYMTNAERCYLYMRSLTMPEDAQRILSYFKRNHEKLLHTSRDIQRQIGMVANRVHEAVLFLSARNYCRIKQNQAKRTPGRSEKYQIEINPEIFNLPTFDL